MTLRQRSRPSVPDPPTYPVPEQPAPPVKPPRTQRLLNFGAVAVAAVTIGGVALTAACEPPTPPPPPPPPPTTVARPQYQPCAPNLNLNDHRCEIRASGDPRTMTVWAAGFAGTTQAPTTIYLVMNLEKQQPDGSWVGANWTNRYSAMSVQTFWHESEPVGCQHGRYRWKLQTTFANAPGVIFYATSGTVTI